MQSILVLWVCLSGGACHPVVGEQMQFMECMMQGQIKAADYIRQNPQYKLKRYACMEPRRVKAVLGRNQA